MNPSNNIPSTLLPRRPTGLCPEMPVYINRKCRGPDSGIMHIHVFDIIIALMYDVNNMKTCQLRRCVHCNATMKINRLRQTLDDYNNEHAQKYNILINKDKILQ